MGKVLHGGLAWIVLLVGMLVHASLQAMELAPYPGVEVVESSAEMQVISRRIILGSLKKINNVLEPELVEFALGTRHGTTYFFPHERRVEEVAAFFRDQMSQSTSILFECKGRDCGSSNYWANDIFRNRILYGPERNQYYIAMTAETGAESKSHVALYIITRGNRRLYAYLEIVDVGEPLELPVVSDPSAILDSFRQDQTLVLTSVSFANDELLVGQSDLTLAVQLLQMAPELSVYVVAHLREEVPLATLLQRSLARAESVVERLIQLGIRVDRLNPQGLGPLVPQCVQDSCADRIELVIQ